MTISLAFLAPNLIKAAVEGRLPRGIGIERLRDPPTEWSRQFDKAAVEGRLPWVRVSSAKRRFIHRSSVWNCSNGGRSSAAALSKFGGYDTSMSWVSGDDDCGALGSASVFKPSLTAARVGP
jgi:hypothetical protein